MNPTLENPTVDPIDLFVSQVWKRIKRNVANDLYIEEVISDQFAWLVSLENQIDNQPQDAPNNFEEWTDDFVYIENVMVNTLGWLESTPEPLHRLNAFDEWTDADEDFNNRCKEIPIVIIVQKDDGIVRKRVCNNIINHKNKVCMRNECTYAHNIAEWSPEMCDYGKKCKTIAKCERLHSPKDTKELLAERLKIAFMEPKKYLKIKMHIKSAAHDKKTK